MARDSLFRIASIAKPITAAATMVLVERGVFGLDDAVVGWLPELAEPMVVRSPRGSVEDVVPAERADHRAAPAQAARGARVPDGLRGDRRRRC